MLRRILPIFVGIGFKCFRFFLVHLDTEEQNTFKMRLFTLFLNIYIYIYCFAKGKLISHVYIKYINNYNDEFILLELNTKEKFYIRREIFNSDIFTVVETFILQQYKINLDNSKSKIIIDIGANIGDSAVFFAKSGGDVYAYEPSNELYDIAIKNAAINNCAVNFFNKGVGSKNGKAKLFYDAAGIDAGAFTLYDSCNFYDDRLNSKTKLKSEKVEIISFSDVLNQFKSIYLVKIDCEGCEFEIFNYIKSSDLDKIAHFIIEYHNEPKGIVTILKNNGFNVQIKHPLMIFADKV